MRPSWATLKGGLGTQGLANYLEVILLPFPRTLMLWDPTRSMSGCRALPMGSREGTLAERAVGVEVDRS